MPYGRRGAEFVVNKKIVDAQYAPSIAGFASGGFIVVWETADPLQDGAGRAIMAQRYDSLGNIVGSEFRVNTSATGEQRAPDVTTLASGGYVITWETSDTTQDGSGTAIKGQLFDSAGVPVGAEFRVNSQLSLNQTVPTVSGLEGGGFVVMWRTSDTTQDGTGGAIKGQVYSASGAAVGGEFLVNAAGFASEIDPAVSGLPGGGFVATWTVNGGNTGDIYAQIFDSSGAKVGSQFLVNTTTALGQDFPAVSQISGGRFVITWDSSVSTSQFDSEIRARIFSADGTPLGNDFVVSTSRVDPGSGVPSDSYQPNVEDLPDGGFFITWTHSSGLANRSSIRGQFFDASGNRVGSEVLVSTVTDRFEDRGDVAVDGNGMVFALWGSTHSSGSSGGMDVHGQIFAPSGAPAIVSNGGGDVVSLSIPENQKAVTTVSAVDPEGSALVYSIVGGADSSFFAINASTGALSFVTAPNFEHRLDWDNNKTFDIVVSVSDGVMTDIQALTVAITDVDEAPVIAGSQTNYTIVENGTAVGTFYATDPEGKAVTWSIAGGADAARFAIDSTGALRFVDAPNFEVRADVGANNIYNVTIGASDGSVAATRALTVQVTNLNEGPVIISAGGADAASFSVSENTGLITTIVADDPDAQDDYGFAIVGGADAALFTIGVSNGVLQFKSGRNFEAPGDSDGNNVYEVIVAVRDFSNSPDTQAIFVTVTNANEAPVITSNGGGSAAAIALSENSLAVTNVVAGDPDGGALSYAISGGADASRFAIDASTGSLSFLTAPDHERPADSDGNNVYDVVVSASDGTISDAQALAITVGNVNESPVISSNGGGSSAFVQIDEGQTAVTTVVGADPEAAGGITYSITGGAHADLFVIDAVTGELSFAAAPDHETPLGGSGNNYSVTVTASDGELSSSQSLQVEVRDVDENVTITSYGGERATLQVGENSFVVGQVTATGGGAITYEIAYGRDSGLFHIDPNTGELQFASQPDYESPRDYNGDNIYEVVVRASNGSTGATQRFFVEVNNVNEGVTISQPYPHGRLMAAENQRAVTVVDAVDVEGDPLTFGIAGGDDAAFFEIDAATGALSFITAPDFEAPADLDGNNIYVVLVSASDGEFTASTYYEVRVGNRSEAPSFVSSGGADQVAVTIRENEGGVLDLLAVDPDGTTPQYGISGGADAALFELDPLTKALRFKSLPDFEAPADSDGDNVYEVVVSATDGTFTDSQSVAVTVGNVDEPVEFVSYGGAAVVAVTSPENSFATGIVVEARDEEDRAVNYAITGGADSESFRIDPATGALSFVEPNAPDFEDPTDFDSDNVHEVVVTASSSTSSATQAFMISITNRNEAPGLYNFPLSVNEGQREVAIVTARDQDGDVPTYAIAGGPDAALFEIDPATGLLSFIEASDYETPLSAAGSNVYTVDIEAGDGRLSTRETFQVTVRNVNEGVAISSGGGGEAAAFTVDENGVAVTKVTAGDLDGDVVTYSIVGGADSSSFAIDARTGALSFVQAPNFEAPGDAGGNNVYDVVVSATDGSFTDSQSLSVTVGNVDEPVELVSYGGAAAVALNLLEDSFAVAVVEARDPDSTIAYSITGGADADSFRIDPVTGALSFEHNAPDFEDPTDSDSDNVHEVVVTASSSSSSVTQAFSISITNRNEAPGLYPHPNLAVDEGEIEVTAVYAYDRDGDVLAFEIVGGPDSALFTLDPATGVLKFIEARDYEAPLSAAGTNVYTLEIEASDGEYASRQTFQVAIRNVNEGLSITSGGGAATFAVTASENFTAVTGIVASDTDGDIVAYSIVGGADSSLFQIDVGTGALRFVQAPNFEAPSDSGGDNVYDVVVSATDGTFTDIQALAVTVANLDEALVITSNGGGAGASVAVSENGTAVTKVVAVDPEGAAVTYAIAGGSDSARFTIDSATGVLAFVSAPNFEAPADAGANNVYDVVVSASDGSFTDIQAIAVTVGNVNEAPVVTSNGGGAAGAVSVAENSTAITVVAATDPDGTAPVYSIVGGADSARFTINPQTGALQFVAAPDWELPGDFDQDNVYSVIVRSSDGQLVDDQALNVTVTNIRDGNTVAGTTGSDSISATSAIIAMRTSNEEDIVFGRDGHDTIYGMAGDDELNGDSGNDVLVGGAGADRLAGGTGKDQFIYNSVSESTGAARDLIADFSRSQGDKISLSGIDANSLVSANQAFTFIGTSAFSNVAGQLRYETSAGITTIFGDVNGDGIADLQIQLSGSIPLIASDFVL